MNYWTKIKNFYSQEKFLIIFITKINSSNVYEIVFILPEFFWSISELFLILLRLDINSSQKLVFYTRKFSALTGGDVKISIAALRCFRLSVFLSSSSCSSLGPIWIEFCREVKLRLSAAPLPDIPLLPFCRAIEDLRKGHDITLVSFAKLSGSLERFSEITQRQKRRHGSRWQSGKEEVC